MNRTCTSGYGPRTHIVGSDADRACMSDQNRTLNATNHVPVGVAIPSGPVRPERRPPHLVAPIGTRVVRSPLKRHVDGLREPNELLAFRDHHDETIRGGVAANWHTPQWAVIKASTDASARVRRSAVSNIRFPSELCETFAWCDQDIEVRENAVKRIENKTVLKNILSHPTTPVTVQELAFAGFANHPDLDRDDENIIDDYAGDPSANIRHTVASSTKSASTLTMLANDDDAGVVKEVFARQYDPRTKRPPLVGKYWTVSEGEPHTIWCRPTGV